MNSEVEAFEGELKVLREFFDLAMDEVEFTDKMTDFCAEKRLLMESYFKRKEIRENYERLNCGV